MIPGFYNHNYLILQTPDYVALQVEMIHDTRIIPLKGRSDQQPRIRQWLGDSVGYWEGDTLVVESTSFTEKAEQRTAIGPFFLTFSSGEHSHLVERFTRIDADTIDYRFTVTDPTMDTKPWTASSFSGITVRPFPDVENGRSLISREGFVGDPVWSPSGNEIFYRNGSRMMSVQVRTEPTFSYGAPESLFQGPYMCCTGVPYDVAADGRFLMLKYAEAVAPVIFVQNWTEELKRLVPTE